RVGEGERKGGRGEKEKVRGRARNAPPQRGGGGGVRGGDDHGPAGEQRAERHPVRGAVHERARGHASRARVLAAFRDLLRRGDRVTGPGGAAERTEEDVLVPPYDPLGHTGRAAGVEDVQVVGRARREVARGRCAGERVLVTGEREQGAQLRKTGPDGVDARRELVVEDEGNRVGIVEQVVQLLLDVSVVHVDRHRAELERGEHPLEVLRRVVEL